MSIYNKLRTGFLFILVVGLLLTGTPTVEASSEDVSDALNDLRKVITAQDLFTERMTLLMEPLGFALTSEELQQVAETIYPSTVLSERLTSLRALSAASSTQMITAVPQSQLEGENVDGDNAIQLSENASAEEVLSYFSSYFGAAPGDLTLEVPEVDETWDPRADPTYMAALQDDPGPSTPPYLYARIASSYAQSPMMSLTAVSTFFGSYVCPVGGPTKFINDWGFPRSRGRTHRGNDMFSERGTPLVAVAAGIVTRADSIDTYVVGTGRGDLGGRTIWLTDDLGNGYYYAHLESIAPSITAGTRVEQGQVIGYLGNSGNAKTTSPHLHFQIHPGGGEPIPPYPFNKAACSDNPASWVTVTTTTTSTTTSTIPVVEEITTETTEVTSTTVPVTQTTSTTQPATTTSTVVDTTTTTTTTQAPVVVTSTTSTSLPAQDS